VIFDEYKTLKISRFCSVSMLSFNLLATNSDNELDQGIDRVGNMLRDFRGRISQNKESIAVAAQELNLAIQDIMNDPNGSSKRQGQPTGRSL
jgi:hypothetical protein